jgi:hypothetical protein
VRDAIELRENDWTTVDFALEVGNVAESSFDSGATPLLESADASIGMTLDERRLSELPVLRGKVFFLGAAFSGCSIARRHRAKRRVRRQRWPLPGAAGVARDGKDSKNAPTEAAGYIIEGGQDAKMEILD